jgi:hypothetical protein
MVVLVVLEKFGYAGCIFGGVIALQESIAEILGPNLPG